MPSTYSTSLRLQLIGNGEQSGTWGTTTNINLGTLLEQAIAGVQTINMGNSNITLDNFNGVSDQARNAVLVMTGSNSGIRNVTAPAVQKLYVIRNDTTGGYAIVIKTSSSTGVTIPNGTTAFVYYDSNLSEFISVLPPSSSTNISNTLVARDSSGNFAAGTITSNLNGNLTAAAPTAPTAATVTNTTQIATTEFVQNVKGTLGSMSSQNADNVTITGGTINGNVVGANAVGARTIQSTSAGAPTLGSSGDIVYQY
jgi:hypothetical protein